jgi:ABC-type branched-subunit amino acid transport system ATPase component/ABC-type branched-subunit amino acid transport system permease subunit
MTFAPRTAWRQLRRAAGDAAGEARRNWNGVAWLAVGALALAFAAPLVVRDEVRRADMAAGLYVVLAAIGLNAAVGLAGMPSLGQGAFVAVGAFGAALLEVKAGWDPTVAIVAAVAASGVAGVVVGAAAVRAAAPFVAIGTWIVAWLVGFALAAFPGLTGGGQGLPVPQPRVGVSAVALTVQLTPVVHYEIAVVAVAVALVAFAVLARAPFGLVLAAARDHRGAAEGLGIDVGRARLRAFVVSAVLGGVAGALGVHLAGLADAGAYGPLLSVELFVAVLLGGEGTVLGPVAGALVLVVVPRVAGELGRVAGVAGERFQPMIAAALLVAAVAAGRGGVVRQVVALWRRLRPGGGPLHGRPAAAGTAPPPPDSVPPPSTGPWPSALDRWRPTEDERASGSPTVGEGPLLEVRDASKVFGGVRALDGVSLEFRAGRVHAIIGPNGSGKTTLLRALAGTLPLDSGSIRLDGIDLAGITVQQRVHRGIVRTLQQVTAFPEMRVTDNVAAGAVPRRRFGGMVRTVAATPRSRGEAHAVRAEVDALLAMTGLTRTRDMAPEELSAADRRFLMVAAACATFPRVLLLDEPGAAMPIPEMRRLAALFGLLVGRGVAVVLVEHNLRLVRRVAASVTVLDAGRVIARGTAQEVAADPAVVEAYLGPGEW